MAAKQRKAQTVAPPWTDPRWLQLLVECWRRRRCWRQRWRRRRRQQRCWRSRHASADSESAGDPLLHVPRLHASDQQATRCWSQYYPSRQRLRTLLGGAAAAPRVRSVALRTSAQVLLRAGSLRRHGYLARRGFVAMALVLTQAEGRARLPAGLA